MDKEVDDRLKAIEAKIDFMSCKSAQDRTNLTVVLVGLAMIISVLALGWMGTGTGTVLLALSFIILLVAAGIGLQFSRKS